MADLTLWQTDDCCPSCGCLLRQCTQADGSLTQECGGGWIVTWTCGNPNDRDAEHLDGGSQ